jgi:hypothetical protein
MHSARTLTLEERRRYEREGYLILRDFFPAGEISALGMQTGPLLGRTDLIVLENVRCWWQLHCDTDELLFESFEPVIDLSPVCARLAVDWRLRAMLRSLFGEEACLFNDKLIFKPAGAIGYEVHQDYRHGTVYPRGVVAVIIPVDPATPENGYTEVFPGYHRTGDLIEHTTDGDRLSPDAIDKEKAVPIELNQGDIALMHCLTPHRSLPNRTDGWRRQLFLSYNAAADGGTCRGAHYAQFIEQRKLAYADMGIANAYFQ